jgi:catechol 2,3-dioxygenase-like lactoylglutathione lyase family enzyme
MVKTQGLMHISLAVRDPERSLKFYSEVFCVHEYFREEKQIQMQGPGAHVVITYEKADSIAGLAGGISHFGFWLTEAADIDLAAAEVERAGGRVLRRGKFSPGIPFTYVADPDGYEIEI